MGGTYRIGKQSMAKYEEGYQAAAKYINAERSEIVLGGSTTQLFMNLGFALQLPPGSEIILSNIEHETNINPWLCMADRLGLTVKWWIPDGPMFRLTPDNLKPLLTEKTKFVACGHVSNILGAIHDVKAVAKVVHDAGALFAVDGVSFAPHRQVDVKGFDVDFYAFSWYKVYGPHIALLYARQSAQSYIKCLGHYFNPSTTLEHKLGLAASNYELVQSLPSIVSYLSTPSPSTVFSAIAAHESQLQSILLQFLTSHPKITVYGETMTDPEIRVPTISFNVEGVDPTEFVGMVEERSNFALKTGHFYSKRLCDEMLGLGEEGVVRVSCVHYNTVEEVRGLVRVLEGILGEVFG